jgi:hypothetical protein
MNTRPRTAVLIVLACLPGAWGCRFEREPAASPFAEDAGGSVVLPPSEPTPSGGRGEGVGSGDEDGRVQPAGGGPASGASGAAGDGSPATAGRAGHDETESDASTDAAQPTDSGAGCTPAAVAVCNPVTNDGCPDSTQCAIDFAAEELAGYCIFSGPLPMDSGVGCLNTGVTESCPGSSTCVDGLCRTLCFCDADCEEEQCCVEPIGDLGFKVCGEC